MTSLWSLILQVGSISGLLALVFNVIEGIKKNHASDINLKEVAEKLLMIKAIPFLKTV